MRFEISECFNKLTAPQNPHGSKPISVELGYIGKMIEYVLYGCTNPSTESTQKAPFERIQGQVFDSENYNVIVRGYDLSCYNDHYQAST